MTTRNQTWSNLFDVLLSSDARLSFNKRSRLLKKFMKEIYND